MKNQNKNKKQEPIELAPPPPPPFFTFFQSIKILLRIPYSSRSNNYQLKWNLMFLISRRLFNQVWHVLACPGMSWHVLVMGQDSPTELFGLATSCVLQTFRILCCCFFFFVFLNIFLSVNITFSKLFSFLFSLIVYHTLSASSFVSVTLVHVLRLLKPISFSLYIYFPF